MSKGLYGQLECNLLFLSFSSGTIYDVHMLGLTDHLVCTMSSNICRDFLGAFQQKLNLSKKPKLNLKTLKLNLKIEKVQHNNAKFIPAIRFKDSKLQNSIKLLKIIRNQRTTRRCSGEYFKWVNFYGKRQHYFKVKY